MIFEVSDVRTGYVVGLDIYTGKNSNEYAKIAKTLDPDCTQITKIVVGLMQKCNLLGKGYYVYLDNYYCSSEFFLELHYLETFACGTVRGGRKHLPKAVTKLKKKGDCVFRRNGPLLSKVEGKKGWNYPDYNSWSCHGWNGKTRYFGRKNRKASSSLLLLW